MPGALQNVFEIRTVGNHRGTIKSAWDDELLHRDLKRLIEGGFVERVGQPSVDAIGRLRESFRDRETDEVYVYTEGWERGSPEFCKLP